MKPVYTTPNSQDPQLLGNFLVKKKGKYLTGHSYATGIGYSFNWSAEIQKARQMEIRIALSMAIHTEGKVIDGNLIIA